jgi:hypothetical protein
MGQDKLKFIKNNLRKTLKYIKSPIVSCVNIVRRKISKEISENEEDLDMKRFMISLIMISLIYNCVSFSYAEVENLSDKKEIITIIVEQSFNVKLENWGEVKFISSKINKDGPFLLGHFLVNKRNDVLYSFPVFDNWNFEDILAVSFKDVNRDGLKDIIVIAYYSAGIGPNGTVPFRYCTIYFQKDKEFIMSYELNDEISNNISNENITIAMVLSYTKNKTKHIDQLIRNHNN